MIDATWESIGPEQDMPLRERLEPKFWSLAQMIAIFAGENGLGKP
jgi:hypothetical protein